jgi:hypothetical protein
LWFHLATGRTSHLLFLLRYARCAAQDAASFARAAAGAIQSAEVTYHRALEETYGALSSTFKILRRALPMTKQPINWAAIANYRIGSDLTSKRA